IQINCNMSHFVAFLTLFLITICPISLSISCDNIYWEFVTCLRYVAAYESVPTTRCCKTIAEFNRDATQSAEIICQCIENLASDLDIRFDLSRIDDLPNKCNEPKPFPISNNMNCSKINH
ncbi:hypothetical protein KIW84_057552, partial [Lathyrus oleraceus]